MGAKSTAATAVKKGAAKVSGKAADEASPASATLEASGVSIAGPKVAPKSVKILTEEEILRAPEKDYMNAAQLDFFRRRLQEMEQDILRNAGETTEHLRETIIVPDPADRATIEEEHALELRTRDRERKLLKKIQQSIVRIDSGDYGYCEETGDPIGIPRLLARPTATLSLEAQERRELKQKMYGE
jgi:DnaK suppressor protein